ncbi:Kynurenine--oxoglutarate transaminase 3-like protein, partial [Leptotrombidium deliense]
MTGKEQQAKKWGAKRIDALQLKQNIWFEFAEIEDNYSTINLGQGHVDFLAPKFVTRELSKAALSSDPMLNQYNIRRSGHPRLINILSRLYSNITQHNVDGDNEILITVGASEALQCAILGHVDPGDEVIIIEPFYDFYPSMLSLANGIPVYVPLRLKSGSRSSRNFMLDENELESKFSSKTKMIIL